MLSDRTSVSRPAEIRSAARRYAIRRGVLRADFVRESGLLRRNHSVGEPALTRRDGQPGLAHVSRQTRMWCPLASTTLRWLVMISCMRLVLIVIGPILLLWLTMSRVPRVRWLTALILTGLALVAAALIYLLPRGVLEILFACVVLAPVTVVLSYVAERSQLGQSRHARVIVANCLLVGWLVVVLCCSVPLWRPGPFFPSADTVLPIPAGLHATVDQVDDGDCGSGSCTRTITVTGRPLQSGQDLYAEMRRHLKARGWGTGCRPVGWLLDRSTECVELYLAGDKVTIALAGDRDDLRHLVTIG